MLINDLIKKELINPPTFLPSNTVYLTRMGSEAYGVSTNRSDIDIYGVCVPPKDYVLPSGYINGFDEPKTFNQWQQHHVKDENARREYDFSIYGIVNYFKLITNCNPNMIDSLFVRRESVIHITQMFELVRENRKLFLHKGLVHKAKGYAFSQLNKAKNCIKHIEPIRAFEEDHNIPHETTHKQAVDISSLSKEDYSFYMKLWEAGLKKTSRFEHQKQVGYDRKFLYHVFRLADQAEYILDYQDLDLQEEGRKEKMKAIRRGDISMESIVSEFDEQEGRLMRKYETSTLRHKPDKSKIRELLLTCLESHYGSVDEAFRNTNKYEDAVVEIQNIFRRLGI